ncbi:oligosaccharide flippase family protein [Pseudomonas sp. D2-3]
MTFNKIFRSISMLWGGAIIGAFFAFLTQVYLARMLGVHDYGQFSAALATVSIITPLAGFGISGFWLRVFGEEGWKAIRWIVPSMYFLVFSSLLSFFVLLGLGVGTELSGRSGFILIALSFYIFGQASIDLCISKAQLEGRYVLLSLWQIVPHLLRLLLVILVGFLWRDEFSSIYVVLSYSFVSALIFLCGIKNLLAMLSDKFFLVGHELVNRSFCIPTIKPTMLEVLKGAFPYGAVGLLYLLYFQSGIVFLGYLSSSDVVGLYNVAFTVLVAIYLFPSVVYQKFLMPMIQRWAYNDQITGYKAYKLGSVAMLLIGLMACFCVFVLGEWFVDNIFGDEYLRASDILLLLSICIPLRFVSSSSGAFLSAGMYIYSKIKIMSIAAGLNITLNLLLIPRFELYGAGFAMVITELFLLIAFFIYAREKVFKKFREEV